MEENHWEDEALLVDRRDLVAILEMRFGSVQNEVQQAILQVKKPDLLQRLILAAANVPDWATFLQELNAGEESFRLVGEAFNPLSKETRGQTR